MSKQWDVEIAAAGRWNSASAGWVEITREHLQGIAAAFNELRSTVKPMIKLGHNNKQPLIKGSDGHPALGWADNVKVVGNKLVATFKDVPDILYDAIQAKRYSRVSVELDRNVKVSGKKYDFVLTAVGLLGADIPAINTLADLQTYMSSDKLDGEHLVFTDFEKERTMSDKELETITARLTKLETEVKETNDENVELTAQVKSLTEERDALKADAEERSNTESLAAFTASVDALVKDGVMLPAQRDEMIKLYSPESADLLTKQVAVFSVGKKAGPSSDEQGTNFTNDDGSGDKSPDVQVVELARKRANADKIEFSAAVAIVLSENTDLAKAYSAMNDGGAS